MEWNCGRKWKGETGGKRDGGMEGMEEWRCMDEPQCEIVRIL